MSPQNPDTPDLPPNRWAGRASPPKLSSTASIHSKPGPGVPVIPGDFGRFVVGGERAAPTNGWDVRVNCRRGPEDSGKAAVLPQSWKFLTASRKPMLPRQSGPASNINMATAANNPLMCSWPLDNARVWWRTRLSGPTVASGCRSMTAILGCCHRFDRFTSNLSVL